MTLHPIDTPEQRRALAESNRRVIAERSGWPDGVLQACEDFDRRHPGWFAFWRPENRRPGFEAPAGYIARRHGALDRDEGIFRSNVDALDALLQLTS